MFVVGAAVTVVDFRRPSVSCALLSCLVPFFSGFGSGFVRGTVGPSVRFFFGGSECVCCCSRERGVASCYATAVVAAVGGDDSVDVRYVKRRC